MTIASLTVRCYETDAYGMRHEAEQLPSYPQPSVVLLRLCMAMCAWYRT